MWHLLRKVILSMPSLAIIDLDTFWNKERLSKQKNFGRIVAVTIQSMMTELIRDGHL